MRIRADVIELLRAGWPNTRIAAQTGLHRNKIAEARQALGIPPHPSGGRAAADVEALFWDRTRPVDGGHLEWTGHFNSHGVPTVRWGGKERSAYRTAFRIEYGRDPKGYVRPGCDHKGCIHPAHVEDRVMRQRTEQTFAAIFGEVAQ